MRLHSFLPGVANVARALLVIMMLAGCGAGAAQLPNPGNTLHSTAEPTSSSPFNSQAAADINGLHIQTNGIHCQARLVLKNPQQLAYDSTQIQEITTYISGMWGRFADTFKPNQQYVPEEDTRLPAVPDTLEWMSGGKDCGGLFELTNTGTKSLQIVGIGATLMSSPVRNTFVYHLINLCTVLNPSPCPFGGGFQCYYTVGVQFQGGVAGTHLDGQMQAVPSFDGSVDSCPTPITLAPAQTVEIYLDLTATPSNLIFKVSPTVTITTSSGTTLLPLPQTFSSTLTFADGSQFSCYDLQGDTFVPDQVSLVHPEDLVNQSPCI